MFQLSHHLRNLTAHFTSKMEAERATVFLSYASEDRDVAESIQLALASLECDVFFDERNLPPGGNFYDRIERAINHCDLFVFLVSSASLSPGKFTHNELSWARDRWASPVDRVLPVNLHGLPLSALPPYLRAATVLAVKGNPAAAVRTAVKGLLSRQIPSREKRRLGKIAITGAVGVAAVTCSFTVTMLGPSGPGGRFQPALPIFVPAQDYVRGMNVAIDQCIPGPGTLSNGPPCNHAPNAAEFEFEASEAGTYRMSINFAADEARPIKVILNGDLISDNALDEKTGGWQNNFLKWAEVGGVALKKGINIVRLERSDVFPHIHDLRFDPVIELQRP
ncbi:TIR domain-containing protein [Variovorax humicola]|uniref:TIR domain-containing protein n=1 Tax=Variovorax humicola TaxID=1769758 RepID=A0ABU8VWM6_9BURK